MPDSLKKFLSKFARTWRIVCCLIPPLVRLGLIDCTEEVVIDGDTATVLGVIHLRATIGDRPVPNLLRSMSVYVRRADSWKLLSRSMTPILKLAQKGK